MIRPDPADPSVAALPPAAPLPIMCIGGAPSSGTTLLADLLDAVPGMPCGPELNIFCCADAYRFDAKFRQAAADRRAFRTGSCYAPHSKFFNTRHLEACGLSLPDLQNMIRSAGGLRDFVTAFARHFARFRGRGLRAFAEKTPINVAQAERFCAFFPDGLFIHLVRDGRSVVASLLRRGYSLIEAAIIWMSQAANGRAAALLFPNVVEIRFEDLLAAPFDTAASLAARVGISAAPSAIETAHRANAYRISLPRVESWSTPQRAGEIRSPNHYRESLSTRDIALLESIGLVRALDPQRFTPHSTFAGLLNHYGYEPDSAGRAQRPALADLDAPFGAYLEACSHLDAQRHLYPVLCNCGGWETLPMQRIADWADGRLRSGTRPFARSLVRIGPGKIAQVAMRDLGRDERTHAADHA